MNEFKRGRTSTCDAPRLGHPIEAATPKIIDKVHDIVLTDRRVKVRELVEATYHCQLENKICKFTLIKMSTIKDSQNMMRVMDIACGCYHSIILIENGEVSKHRCMSPVTFCHLIS